MTSKIYYFSLPNQIEHEMYITMEKLFSSHFKKCDVEQMCFTYCNKEEYDFYTFLSPFKIGKLVNEFKLQKVLFSFKDISEEVLLGVQNNNPVFVKTFRNIKHKQLLNVFLNNNQQNGVFKNLNHS